MKSALLVGFGSVGQRHLTELSKRYESICVIDPKFENSNLAEKPMCSNWNFVPSFSGLNGNVQYGIAVIASWGPTHLKVLKEVVALRPEFILLEKPVESSLQKIDEIENTLNFYNLPATVNFHLRYSPLRKIIESVIDEQDFGDICSVNLTAGAKCIATNGIHYLDLIMQLFSETPYEVSAQLYSDAINPRESTLSFLGGVANFAFSQNRFLTLNFSNKSYADLTLEMIFEKGKLVYENGRVNIYSVEDLDKFKNLPRTRSVRFDHLIKTFLLPIDQNLDGISNLYNFIAANTGNFDIRDATESTRQILRACIASKRGKKLRYDESLPDEDLQNDWMIS